MARLLVALLCLMLAVSLIGALVQLLLMAAAVVLAALFMALLYRVRRSAFWSLVVIGGLFLLVKVGPWSLAAVGLWLLIEAVAAIGQALRRDRPGRSVAEPIDRLQRDG